MKFKKYTILKDNHCAKGMHMGLTFKNHINFEVYFDENCLYDFKDIDKFDINKLYGFSTSYFHHYQSARVGWRCLDSKNIEILTYSYCDGIRNIDDTKLIGTVKPNEKFTCSIGDAEHHYVYTFKKEGGEFLINTDMKNRDWFPFNYKLYPYFGGNKTAPHDMDIYIKSL